MHWTVHITDQMHQHLQIELLLFMRQSASFQLFVNSRHGSQYIAFGIARHGFNSLALIDYLDNAKCWYRRIQAYDLHCRASWRSKQ